MLILMIIESYVLIPICSNDLNAAAEQYFLCIVALPSCVLVLQLCHVNMLLLVLLILLSCNCIFYHSVPSDASAVTMLILITSD